MPLNTVIVDSGHIIEVEEASNTFCSCTGACKTNRCICKKLDQGCTPGKCRCKPSKCSRQKEEANVKMKELGELHCSDSEPEDFCICKDSCSNTRCFCLAIKQGPCQSQCKCDRAICSNRPGTSHSGATTGVQALPGPSVSIEQDVHRYCDTHSKEELGDLLATMAANVHNFGKM